MEHKCQFFKPNTWAQPLNPELTPKEAAKVRLHDRVSQAVWIIFLLIEIAGIALCIVGAKTPCPLPHPLMGTFLILGGFVWTPLALSIISCSCPPPENARAPEELKENKEVEGA
jgi:hypothetical protein